jgi:CHAT domain-containing protein/tetratricopeptide (TPR) repeat protein
MWVVALLTVAVALTTAQEGTSLPDVRMLIAAGRYSDAELAAQRLSDSLSDLTRGSPQVNDALDMVVETRWRNGRNTASTRALADKAVAAARAAHDDMRLARSLSNLGRVLILAGTYPEAVAVFQQAIDVLQRSVGPNHPDVGNALDAMATALLAVDRHVEAKQALERARRIKESVLPAEDVTLARTLELQSLLLQRTGDYSSAEIPLVRALAIREHLQPAHPDLARALWLAGELATYKGNILEARNLLSRSLAIADGTLRPEHPDIADYANRLAGILAILGDLSGAIAVRERAVSITKQSLGEDHPVYAGYLNDLADLHFRAGDLPLARAMYERALQKRIARLGSVHQNVATILYNLGEVNRELGDLIEARRQFNGATNIWRQRLGPNHPFVATGLGGTALVLLAEHRDAEALKVLDQARTIRERTLGTEHADVATTLLDIARTLARLGRFAEAERLSARAATISDRAHAAGTPGLAVALALQADLLTSLGQYDAARPLYERALAIDRSVFGPSHNETTTVQTNLAALIARAGDTRSALRSALDAENANRDRLRLTVRYLPEREAVSYTAARSKPLNLVLATIAPDPSDREVVRRVLDAVIRSRALVLDEITARQRITNDRTEPTLAPLQAAVTSARERLANLAVQGPDENRPQQYLTLFEDARRDKELAERGLADHSATFRAELTDDPGLDRVASALPPASALVSFVKYQRDSGVAAGNRTTVGSYAALVLRFGDPQPTLIPLGGADTLEAAVSKWRIEAATGPLRATTPAKHESSYRATAEQLRRLVWDPVASYLFGIDRVFIVPDGALNLVNFSALPVGATDYLVDRDVTIHYLSAERDLVPPPAIVPRGEGLLAIGGAAFNTAITRSGPPEPLRGISSLCAGFRSLTFTALPGTFQEASAIVDLWNQAAVTNGQLLTGDRASERAFKNLAPGRRVLHLATHGFFLGSDCLAAAADTRAVGGVVTARPQNDHLVPTGSPLLLSGLALAGANQRAARARDVDDGILTAEEVGALNLTGVEWAVLSACDTGLGEITAGEGVLGLRRAFQVAGVRTVIMSLWSVQDEAARRWMTALYEARLRNGLDTATSVRNASRFMLKERRAAHHSTHPFYWAGFVAAGDWR